jgi:acetate kinase
MRVLVVNAGSSSLKLRVLADTDEVTASADLPAPRGALDGAAIKAAIESFGPVDAAGHRIVHGGILYTAPVLVDAQVRRRLEGLTDLAPLHQPKSLAALDAVQSAYPDLPAVACFDTAFHATIPAAAATFALPAEWRTRWALRRYGFHGLSHAYASSRAAELLGRDPEAGGGLRVVTCHLGAGASLAAVRGGRSVDTTMGFTPLDGLVMATRSGSVDPGLVLWLEEHAGMPPAELAATLEYRSGLQGLAGTADMREVLSRAAAGDAKAELAREVYLHRLCGSIAAMAAAMNGLDVLVFTGGVGENSPEIRERAMGRLGFLGVAPDLAHNAGGTGDREIGQPGPHVRSMVISAREDIEIAGQVRSTLGSLAFRPLSHLTAIGARERREAGRLTPRRVAR